MKAQQPEAVTNASQMPPALRQALVELFAKAIVAELREEMSRAEGLARADHKMK